MNKEFRESVNDYVPIPFVHESYDWSLSLTETQPPWIRSGMDYGERNKTRWASSWTSRSAWPYFWRSFSEQVRPVT